MASVPPTQPPAAPSSGLPEDPMMNLLLQTANYHWLASSPPLTLPPSLQGDAQAANQLRDATKKRASFIHWIEEDLAVEAQRVLDTFAGLDLSIQCPGLMGRLDGNARLQQRTAWFLGDSLPVYRDRLQVCLRLYAGYLGAAKTIAWAVTGGRHTDATRAAANQLIETNANNDEIYRAGVETAPLYKCCCLGEPIFRDGIPNGSVVLRDWADLYAG